MVLDKLPVPGRPTYPRMTSFSDPKGIIHTVTMFHIKAEFL